MATPLGNTSFTDEEVVAQSDVQLMGTMVKTLTVEFDQARYEELLSSGSLSPKAIRKIRKVSKETKSPSAVDSSKGDSLKLDCLNRLSSEEESSVSKKLVDRVKNSTIEPQQKGSGHKRPLEATNPVITEDDIAARALKQAKKNAARQRRRSQRRAQLRESRSLNQRELRVCEPRVCELKREPRVSEPNREPRDEMERSLQWRVVQTKRRSRTRVQQLKRDPQGGVSNTKRDPKYAFPQQNATLREAFPM